MRRLSIVRESGEHRFYVERNTTRWTAIYERNGKQVHEESFTTKDEAMRSLVAFAFKAGSGEI